MPFNPFNLYTNRPQGSSVFAKQRSPNGLAFLLCSSALSSVACEYASLSSSRSSVKTGVSSILGVHHRPNSRVALSAWIYDTRMPRYPASSWSGDMPRRLSLQICKACQLRARSHTTLEGDDAAPLSEALTTRIGMPKIYSGSRQPGYLLPQINARP